MKKPLFPEIRSPLALRRAHILWLLVGLAAAAPATRGADPARYPDRLVWVFGWGLGRESDVAEISKVLETAGESGLNGAVLSAGLDSLCKKPPEYFARLQRIREACERSGLELIPAVFSVGYGGGALEHDRHLAEGLPVEDAPFLVKGGEARLVPDPSARIANGGFEEFTGHKLQSYSFHDQPGEVSFVDTQVKRTGRASLRFENFKANPHGHGRVMQEIKVKPHRSYRVSLWVKTEGFKPSGAFSLLALAKDRDVAPRSFNLQATADWRKLTMIVNSLEFDALRLYAGLWGGREGKVWLDDWEIEEVGPLNVLRRPGTPVTVCSEDGATAYAEGTDFARLEQQDFSPYRVEGDPLPLRLLPGSRIQEGQRLRVSWFHPMVVHDSQVTVCMGEPELYEIYDHEAKLLAEHLRPRRVLFNMDEVRMGGTCRACRGRDMGELLGECITRQAQSIRRHSPGAQVYIWSDMLDPNHNAHGNYYLVSGDFTGSWKHVPKDLIMAVWGGEPREKSLRFFAEQGFQALVACYYDASDLSDVKAWLQLARGFSNIRGFMYTPWQRKYELLSGFGELLR
jgi:hypothetical protein